MDWLQICFWVFAAIATGGAGLTALMATGVTIPGWLGTAHGMAALAGLALLFVVVAVGRTRATIEVAGGRLQVELDNLLHTRVREWKRGEIQAIRVRHIEKPSGHRDPVAELQVLGGDRPLGFLAGRPEEELRWIAGVIQKALQTRPARRRHRPV